jgi:hypothetical protein
MDSDPYDPDDTIPIITTPVDLDPSQENDDHTASIVDIRTDCTDLITIRFDLLVSVLVFTMSSFRKDSSFCFASKSLLHLPISSFQDSRLDVHLVSDWKSFPLCPKSTVKENKQTTLFVCPVREGRFAVPMVHGTDDHHHNITDATVHASYEAYHMRYHDGYKRNDLYAPIFNRVMLWSTIMHFLATIQNELQEMSLNQMLGTLALRRTIARCLIIYEAIAVVQFDAPLEEHWLWRYCIEKSRLWDSALKKQMENSEVFQKWQEACEIIGYDPRLYHPFRN